MRYSTSRSGSAKNSFTAYQWVCSDEKGCAGAEPPAGKDNRRSTHIVCVDESHFAVPQEGEEAKLAHALIGRKDALDRRVLEELLGDPKRFRDLRHLVGTKSDTLLTRTLSRLGDAGLVRQGLNLKDPGDPRYYAATRLGVQVALKAHEFRPVADVMAELRDLGLLEAS